MADTPEPIIRLHDLGKYTGLGRTKNKQLVKQGEFDVIDLGARARGVTAHSVAAWQQRRREASRAKKKAE
jgi:hypothetical protein